MFARTEPLTRPLLLALTVSGMVTAATCADLPIYRVQVLGSGLEGYAMNERGDATGRMLLSGSIGRAFIAHAGGTTELLPLPAEWQSSDGYAINASGVVVGAVSTISIATVGSHAAAWYPTAGGYQFVLLGALPGHLHSTATGVNDLGDIVGGSGGIGLGLYNNSVLFTPDGPMDLPGISLAADVNNQRVVVAGNMLLDLNTLSTTTIPLPPGNWQGAGATDLNNNNGFCGYIAGFSGCSNFPVRYLPGSGMEIIGGCATSTSAVSLNDQGDALTAVYNGGVGAVFIEAGYTNISSLIEPSQGPWIVTGVSTINNARQILVEGRIAPDYLLQLLRLTPIVAGDLTGDGRVDGADLGMLLGSWGATGGAADLDQSGTVDGADLGALLGAWTV